jgi:hypothetical protein
MSIHKEPIPFTERKNGAAATRRFGFPPFNKFRFDANSGEWQRVLSRGNRHGPLVDTHPRAQRVRDELAARQERHTQTTVWGLLTAAFAGGFYQLVTPLSKSPDWSLGGLLHWATLRTAFVNSGIHIVRWHDAIFGPFASLDRVWLYLFMFTSALLLSLLFGLYFAGQRAAKALWDEIVYALGFQFVSGAKVCDPEPHSPGSEEVANQKVHGGARLASENETREAALHGGARSPVHKQKF